MLIVPPALEGLVPFCPQCKKLAYPVDGKLQCKNPSCGWRSDAVLQSKVVVNTPINQREQRVILEKKEEARPEQVITCPKCQHDKAYFHLMQTRKSDEPPTQINECVKCGHSWREY
jgi:DNA-directed RNA polymerase subunit M